MTLAPPVSTFLKDAVRLAIMELREEDAIAEGVPAAFRDHEILQQIHGAEDELIVEIDDIRDALESAEFSGLVARVGTSRWDAT